ncbi:GlcG/HbpS family heme-binding protein [Sulfurivermis fontis]|uniref:GlcG/HbpS family heme-binding protein n=1 Tax=Sulfurivermis fontis TaxID=1972068 RepID=UPI000FD7EB66|nr:heme-binding protein [Sulfurivermis fontis]
MNKNKLFGITLASVLALGAAAPAAAEDEPIVNIKRLSMEMALKLAQAAIAQCRKEGIQIGVTVIDRGGHPQVVLRDVLAPDLTLTISRQKAYTAMSFNSPTSAMENRFTQPFSVGKVEGLVFSAGGLPITAGGMILGGVGVSGAPTGEQDERCARSGLESITADLEMGAF